MSTPAATAALSWLQRIRATPPEDAHEALALAIHALLLQHGFRAVTTGADEGQQQHQQQQQTAANPTETDAPPATLPNEWGPAVFGGRYRHPRSAMTFDIRAVRMPARLMLHAAPIEDDAHLHTFNARLDQYLVPDTTTWQAAVPRLDDLATVIAVQIAHRLVPDATKPGYEHAVAATEAASSNQPQTAATPAPQPGPRPVPPGPEGMPHDPLRIGPIRRPGRMPMPVRPFGADDLLPPALQPGAMGVPSFGPGGNLMGPAHLDGRRGLPRGGGRLPPGVPPGARYDPIYPIPDNDAELPPGFDDDHRLRGPPQARPGPRPGGPPGPAGLDDPPPPGMYW